MNNTSKTPHVPADHADLHHTPQSEHTRHSKAGKTSRSFPAETTRLIGIAGGSGSGKSTFAKQLQEAYPDQIALLNCDNYYLPHDDMPLAEREHLNYDAPDAIEFSLMFQHLKLLKQGIPIECPVYDFSLHTRSSETKTVEPKPFILIDGILLLSNSDIRDILDLKIFVETDADERILRRARRDVIERGRTIESVMEQYLKTVKPMHNLYVEPSKVYADLILNGGLNPKAVEVVKAWIKANMPDHSDSEATSRTYGSSTSSVSDAADPENGE